jgi:hypothetical protein
MEMINDEGGSNFFLCHKIIIHQPQGVSSIDLFTNPFLHALLPFPFQKSIKFQHKPYSMYIFIGEGKRI